MTPAEIRAALALADDADFQCQCLALVTVMHGMDAEGFSIAEPLTDLLADLSASPERAAGALVFLGLLVRREMMESADHLRVSFDFYRQRVAAILAAGDR